MVVRKKIGIFFLLTLVFFLPLYLSPGIVTERGNDLSEVFIPSFVYIKEFFQTYHTLPFWQNLTLFSSPLLGDPQNPWLYPPNLLSFFISVKIYSFLSFSVHFFLAGYSMYLFLRALKISETSAFLGGIIYMFAPKMTAHLEAGHLNMLVAFSYAPLCFLSLRKILENNSAIWSMVLGFALGFMFINYFTIFYYSAFAVMVYFFYLVIEKDFGYQKIKPKKIVSLISFSLLISVLIFIGTTLPQLVAGKTFFTLSNRGSLTFSDIAVPLWSFKKFFFSLFWPWGAGYNTLGTEEMLFPGFLPFILSSVGFFSLKRRKKIYLGIIILLILLVCLNTKTPFYSFLYNYLFGFRYLRVTTRIWFIASILIAALSGLALDKLHHLFISKRSLVPLIGLLIIVELFFYGYLRFMKTTVFLTPLPIDISSRLQDEKEFYRVYCTTGCLRSAELLKYHKSNVGGYNPVQMVRFTKYLGQAAGYRYSEFAPILPPYEVFKEKPQPDPMRLGLLNTRYVISPYKLTNPDFIDIERVGNLRLYRNMREKPYIYWKNSEDEIKLLKIERLGNDFRIETQGLAGGKIVLSELFSPNWKAIADLGVNLPVLAEHDIIVSVPLTVKTDFILLKNRPEGFPYTLIISATTYCLSGVFFLRKILA